MDIPIAITDILLTALSALLLYLVILSIIIKPYSKTYDFMSKHKLYLTILASLFIIIGFILFVPEFFNVYYAYVYTKELIISSYSVLLFLMSWKCINYIYKRTNQNNSTDLITSIVKKSFTENTSNQTNISIYNNPECQIKIDYPNEEPLKEIQRGA